MMIFLGYGLLLASIFLTGPLSWFVFGLSAGIFANEVLRDE